MERLARNTLHHPRRMCSSSLLGCSKSERHGAGALQGKIQEWAKGAGAATDLADICKDPKTSDFLLKELNTTGREGKLKVGGARATAVQAVAIFWQLCCLWRLLLSTWFSCDPALQQISAVPSAGWLARRVAIPVAN